MLTITDLIEEATEIGNKLQQLKRVKLAFQELEQRAHIVEPSQPSLLTGAQTKGSVTVDLEWFEQLKKEIDKNV